MQKSYEFLIKELDVTLQLTMISVGSDFLGIIQGPNSHIGGVSLASPYEKSDRDKASVSLSSISEHGHQDVRLTQEIASKLAKELTTRVVIVGGLHIDNLSSQGLNQIFASSNKLIEEILRDLKRH